MQCRNDFESGSNGTNITTGNSASPDAWDAVTGPGAGASALAYDSAIKMRGALSGKFQSGGSAGTDLVTWSTKFGTQTTWYGRGYLYLTGASPTQNRSGMKSNGNVRWAIATNSKIELWNNLGAVGATSATTVTNNSWARIEWKLVHSTTVGSFEMKIFLTPDSVTPTETFSFTGANTAANCTSATFGIYTSVVSHPAFYFDDIEVNSTGYPGPSAAATAKTSSGFTDFADPGWMLKALRPSWRRRRSGILVPEPRIAIA